MSHEVAKMRHIPAIATRLLLITSSAHKGLEHLLGWLLHSVPHFDMG